MTKFINEENLTEAARIIKQYVDENSGGEIQHITETDTEFKVNAPEIAIIGSSDFGVRIQQGRGNSAIVLNEGNLTLIAGGGAGFVSLTPTQFTYNGTSIITKPIGSPVCTLPVSAWSEDKELGFVFVDTDFFLDPQKRNEIDVLPESVEEWANCGVIAISEEVNQLTFKCSTIPTNDLYFRVVSTEVNYVSQ